MAAPHGRGAQQSKIADLFMLEIQKKRKELESQAPLKGPAGSAVGR